MAIPKKNIIWLLILWVTACPSLAQRRFGVYWENDGTFVRPNGKGIHDRHYTNGLKLTFSDNPDYRWLREFGYFNDFAPADTNVQTAMGYSIGQNIYTPDHVAEPAKRYDKDMPFAGWLYSSIYIQRQYQYNFEHFELDLGLIGPSSQADNAQTNIHKMVGLDKPKGWSDQLQDEFHANVTYRRKFLFCDNILLPTDWTDWIGDYSVTAGSLFRHAEAGITWRLGEYRPNDFGPAFIHHVKAATFVPPEAFRSFYVFIRVAGRFVQFNRFLTGLDATHAVGYLSGGLVWQKDDLEIGYSQTVHSNQFHEQKRTDAFATFYVLSRF